MIFFKTVNFGCDSTGLTTVSYTLISQDGTINKTQTSNGIFEVKENSGVYGANINFDENWNGIILWNDGNDLFASEEYNYLLEDTTSTIDLTVQEIERDGGTLDRIENKVDIISNDLKRALGLMHENIFIDLPNYDDDNNLIGARVRIYSDAISVGTTNNVLATYIISSDGDGCGKFTNWKQILS